MFVRCSNSSSDILAAAHQNTQTVVDATQKEIAIDQQQHSCETLICQCHETILRLLSSAATASTRRFCKLYCRTIVSYLTELVAFVKARDLVNETKCSVVCCYGSG